MTGWIKFQLETTKYLAGYFGLLKLTKYSPVAIIQLSANTLTYAIFTYVDE